MMRLPQYSLPAGSLPLGPLVRVLAMLLALCCLGLVATLLRESAAMRELVGSTREQSAAVLDASQRALVALEKLRARGEVVLNATDPAVRASQVQRAQALLRTPDFAADERTQLDATTAAEAIREISERLSWADKLEREGRTPVLARRLRDEARARWHEAVAAIDQAQQRAQSAPWQFSGARLAAIATANSGQQRTVLLVAGLLLAALGVGAFVVLRQLLTPILRASQALSAIDARLPPATLPTSGLAEIEMLYRMVERNAYALSQADALAWRSVAIDANANAIIITDTQGKIEYVNPAFTAITGYTAEEAIGQTPRVLKSGSHDAAFYERFWRTILAGREWRGEMLNRRKDGSLFNDLMTISPVLDDGGRVVRFIAMHQDITRRNEAERQLRARTEDLQRYRNEREAENALAREIMARQLRCDDAGAACVHSWSEPDQPFGGDVVAAARAPDGTLFVLLADAIGHGLVAAVGALPLLARFHDLVAEGRTLRNLVWQLNRAMRSSLPDGHFVAAGILAIDAAAQGAQVWLGGLPDMMLVGADGRLLHRIASTDVALGVADRDEGEFDVAAELPPPGSQFVFYTAGLVAATNAEGEHFTPAMLEGALRRAPRDGRLAATRSAWLLHVDGQQPDSEATLVLVDSAGGAA